MSFQVIDGSTRTSGRARSAEPTLSYYNRTAQFRLNEAAYAAMGTPAKIEALYDPDTNRLGFTATDSVRSVVLRADSEKSKSRYFGFSALAGAANINDVERFTLPLTFDEASGFWVVDLNLIPETAHVPEGTPEAPVTEEKAGKAAK